MKPQGCRAAWRDTRDFPWGWAVTCACWVFATLPGIGLPARALAQEAAAYATPEGIPQTFGIHGQFTYVEQETDDFNSPYKGANSLPPSSGNETIDATLFLGVRLWSGAEAWLNPEVDQGFGLGNTTGVAAFPSGEAYKLGRNHPYFRFPRIFIRDTVNLPGELKAVAANANWLGGTAGSNRLVFTLGKFSVTDIFDDNQYAHDPRGDFLNWAAIDAGSFDYAADAWGYTVGAAAEWYQDAWTARAGIFDLPRVPNSEHLEPGFHEFQMILELEHRHELAGQPGKLMVTVFDSRARMGLLDQAVNLTQLTGTPVDITAVRQYRSRWGADLNLEQQICRDLGAFARAGKATGNVETFAFTDIDRAVSMGLSLKGALWSRTQDTVGIAVIDSNISAARQRYLNAGGLGLLVGDGKLPRPGPEQILETFYSAAIFSPVQLTFDYQRADHPAYNRDRGPVSIFAVRFHAQL